MKTLKNCLLILTLITIPLITGCQKDDYVIPTQKHHDGKIETFVKKKDVINEVFPDKEALPSDAGNYLFPLKEAIKVVSRDLPLKEEHETTLPRGSVYKKDFEKAVGFRVTYTGGSYDTDTWKKVRTMFNTLTGSIHSIDFLNSINSNYTKNMDMSLFFWQLEATSEFEDDFNYGPLRKTKFKTSGMTLEELINAAVNTPNDLKSAYEDDWNEPQGSHSTPEYSAGQIFTFKTDRNDAKYGAVRIVQTVPRIIEVVVQK